MTKQPHTFRNAHQRRSAFTLFEMLLVLALLLVLVSVVWPAVMRISSSNRLRQSMQDVNSVFAAARIRAIEHGVNYHVYLELGGNQYLIVPVDQSLLGLNTDESGSTTAGTSDAFIVDELPEEFQFSKMVSATVTESMIPFEWLSGLPNAKDLRWVESSFPITFYPDGTAALDLQHDILKKEQKVARIELRGLTGNTTISYEQEKSP
ncbi:prepilin-type N-terminal cleavage/methylation domain-containing protein [Gimesia maris]|uniref:prepilin-type N-terminal cleavage/methylation domain-containing protein n=1 Tax=Gimesia maris TaxID=122 RepID=UPI0030D72E69